MVATDTALNLDAKKVSANLLEKVSENVVENHQ